MQWLPRHLFSLCLAGVVLLHVCHGQEEDGDGDFDVTAVPDYDYNFTFDYIFYSNTSSGTLDLEEFFRRGHEEEGGEEYRDEEDDDGDEEHGEDRGPTTDAAPSTASPSLLLFLCLPLLQLCRLL